MKGWQGLLEQLAAAGEVVAGPTGGRTDRELAEGYRHLTRILSIATEMLVEKGDPAHPAFTRWMTAHRKMYGDNPGTVYDAALLSPTLTYVIRGSRGTCAYLGCCLYGTAADGAKRIAGNLDDDAMTFAADGSFELWLGGAAREGNWLPLDDDITEVMVRQYFFAPGETEATYTIETVPSLGPPPPVTLAEVDSRLLALGRYVRETVEAETTLSALSATLLQGLPSDVALDMSAVVRVMPTPAIQYSGQWFDDLGDDEALLVEGTAPVCRYWSIQLLTRFMESGDWEHHPVFLTGSGIELADDGRFLVVVSHRDPGVPNWITTTGLTSANVAVRALKAEGPLDLAFRRVRLPLERRA